jgi:hypothetical protein
MYTFVLTELFLLPELVDPDLLAQPAADYSIYIFTLILILLVLMR